MRRAFIGDIHACADELVELLRALFHHSLDEIWHVGDLVDRGPDNGAVVEICRTNGIRGVMGNHESSIINHWDRMKRGGKPPISQDKVRTIGQLNDDDVEYMRALPHLHVFDDVGLVIAHGGLYPRIPLYAQPENVIRAQLIHPFEIGKSCWWGEASVIGNKGMREDEMRKKGWERWYRLYDHEYDTIYGHSVWMQPFIHQNEGYGKTIGIDTGSCFGGSLTACIYDGRRKPYFISVKAKRPYAEMTNRKIWET